MKLVDKQILFEDWIKTAPKGASFTYLTSAKHATDSEAIATQAWLYSERGLVSLVQRRVSRMGEEGGGTFDYIAQRTGRAA